MLTLSLQVAPYDTSIRVDPLSVLPVEIVQQILLHLPPASYISTKFVNHDFHAATLLSSGHDLRGFRGTRDTKNPDQHEYVSGVIELEIHTRYRLELLSCYHCGKRAGNDLNGFSDEQFGQAFEYRACLKCRKSCSATVKGVVVRRCHSCNQYVAGEAGEDGEWMPVPAH